KKHCASDGRAAAGRSYEEPPRLRGSACTIPFALWHSRMTVGDIETFELRPGYRISRIVRGGWQLAGGHGQIERAEAVADLAAFAEAGILTFDCADIYAGVEDLIGAFRADYARRHGAEALARLKVHTKFVPDLELL